MLKKRLRLEPLELRHLLSAVPYVLDGINLSPYIDAGEDPDKGDGQITDAELWDRMETLAPYTDSFRSFGCNEDLKEVGQFAHALGAEAVIGAWISSDPAENQSQIDCLLEQAILGHVDMAIVGSEVLLRNDVTEEVLIGYINDVKSSLAAAGVNIPVTTADVYGELLAHPAVLEAVDVVLANYYPFWEGSSVDTAVARVHRWHEQLVAAAGGKEVVVSETGWPSEGEALGDALPSPENAAFYFLNFVSWARAENVDYFYFEAYDEPWKTKYEGERGAYWGIFDTAMALKPGMEAVFNGDTMEDNWSDPPTPPIVDFTTMPEVVTTNIGTFVVTGTTDPDHVVKVNGQTLSSTSFGVQGEFAHTLALTEGQNTVVLEIEDSVGTQIVDSTKSILFDPSFSTEDHNLLYVDVVPGDSTAPALDGTVVVDVDENTILGVLPYHVRGMSPSGTEVYMDDRSVVSTSNHQVIRTLPFSSDIPLSGFLVSPNGDRLYSRDEMVDVASNTLLATRISDITTCSSWASASFPGGPAITVDGTTIYAGNSVLEIDPSTGTTIATGITGLYMSDIAVSPDGSLLLVSEYSYNSGRLDIYDRATFELLETVGGIGDFAGEITFLTDTLAVVGSAGNPASGSGVVSVVDLSTYTVIQQIPISLADNLAVALDEREVYAATGMSDALLGDRFGIDVLALDEDGRLYRTKTICLGVNAFSSGTGRPRNDQIRRVLVKAAPPEVVSVYVTDSTVTDVDTGPGATFGVTVEFSKPMTIDGTADPTVFFNPSVAATLTLNTGLSRWLNEYRYQAVYDVVDDNVEIWDITIGVAGAKDTAGNPLQEYTPEIEFSIDTLSDTLPPTAIANASPITTGNSDPQTVTVVFRDDQAVSVASIGDGDIVVTGPNGYREMANLVPGTISPATDGTPITAEYTIVPPGAVWDICDNGTYVVSLLANEVSDTSGNAATTVEIGEFSVNVADMAELLGTPGSDTFHFTKLADEFIVTVNGISQSFDASITTAYRIDGLDGNDQITVQGTDEDEMASLQYDSLDVAGQTYHVHAVNVETVIVDGNGGADSLEIYDWTGDDTFAVDPTQATMDWGGDGVDVTGLGFETVKGVATNGGIDVATLTGTTGADKFYGKETLAYVYDAAGTDYRYTASGFDFVTGVGGGGDDTAYLYGSSGDDTLDVTVGLATMARAGSATTAAIGFAYINGYAVAGGTDTATMTGTTGTDLFTGKETYAYMRDAAGADYLLYVAGFSEVTAYGNGDAADAAYLYGSTTDDTLDMTVGLATLTRSGSTTTVASNFATVCGYAVAGGTDTTTLTGTTGTDQFYVDETYAYMRNVGGADYFLYAGGFSEVTAYGGGGVGDVATLTGTTGADKFYGKATQAYVYDAAGSDYRYTASGFDTVTGVSGGGDDTAYLYGSTGDDTLDVTVGSATMTRAGSTTTAATGFSYVNGYAVAGGTDTATMTGTTATDVFTGKETYAYMRNDGGDDYLLYVTSFSEVTAYGDGSDTAYLYGGVTDDTLQMSVSSSTLTRSGSTTSVASDFGTVNGYAGAGGTDTATMTGSTGTDLFSGKDTGAYMRNVGGTTDYFLYAASFSQVTAYGNGGADLAYLYGSSSDDTLELNATSSTMTRAGSTTTVANDFATAYGYAGAGGTDTATLTGTTGADAFYGRESLAYMRNVGGGDYFLYARDFSEVTANGNGGDDAAYLWGSAGDDTLDVSVGLATMTRTGSTTTAANDFATVYGYATSGGTDTASLTGSTGDDVFYSREIYSILRDAGGTAYQFYVGAFDSVEAYGNGGVGDTAYLYGSAGNDTLDLSVDSSTMARSGSSTAVANEFAAVNGYAVAGGTDTATLTGSTGADTFLGKETYGYMENDGGVAYSLYADKFSEVTAYGNGGDDTAYLYGSMSDDTLAMSVGLSTMTRSGSTSTVASDFATVKAYAVEGGTDTATLTGTTGADTFTGRDDWGILRDSAGTDYYSLVRYFDEVYADAGDTTTGNDTLDVPETAGVWDVDYLFDPGDLLDW